MKRIFTASFRTTGALVDVFVQDPQYEQILWIFDLYDFNLGADNHSRLEMMRYDKAALREELLDMLDDARDRGCEGLSHLETLIDKRKSAGQQDPQF